MDEFLQYIMPYSYEILRHKLTKHYINFRKFTKLPNYYGSANRNLQIFTIHYAIFLRNITLLHEILFLYINNINNMI